MKKLIAAAGIALLAVSFAFAGGDGEEASDLDFTDITLEGYSRVTDEDQKFDLQWKVDGDLLHVQMAAFTEGWIAVGFDPGQMMADANFLIGYVAGGSVFLSDHYGSGTMKHEPDEKLGGEENFTNATGEEASGATVIRFTIPLDSGDRYDKPLVPGQEYKVIFAYGGNNDDDFVTYHSRRRGSFEITL